MHCKWQKKVKHSIYHLTKEGERPTVQGTTRQHRVEETLQFTRRRYVQTISLNLRARVQEVFSVKTNKDEDSISTSSKPSIIFISSSVSHEQSYIYGSDVSSNIIQRREATGATTLGHDRYNTSGATHGPNRPSCGTIQSKQFPFPPAEGNDSSLSKRLCFEKVTQAHQTQFSGSQRTP